MEGTEARIEKRSEDFGLAAVIRDLREKHPEVEKKPVWQEPSRAGSYNTITRPAHYARFAIEPLDFIKANNFNFLVGNVIKYVCRYDAKNGLEDLRKAREYLDHLIGEEEKKAAPPANKMFVPPYPREGDYPNWPAYMTAIAEWDSKYGTSVRDARQEVGSQPASDDAEHGADRRDGPQ